jgi:hypothetical protein
VNYRARPHEHGRTGLLLHLGNPTGDLIESRSLNSGRMSENFVPDGVPAQAPRRPTIECARQRHPRSARKRASTMHNTASHHGERIRTPRGTSSGREKLRSIESQRLVSHLFAVLCDGYQTGSKGESDVLEEAQFETPVKAVPDALVGMDQRFLNGFVDRCRESSFGYDRDSPISRPVEVQPTEPAWQIRRRQREGITAGCRGGTSVRPANAAQEAPPATTTPASGQPPR